MNKWLAQEAEVERILKEDGGYVTITEIRKRANNEFSGLDLIQVIEVMYKREMIESAPNIGPRGGKGYRWPRKPQQVKVTSRSFR